MLPKDARDEEVYATTLVLLSVSTATLGVALVITGKQDILCARSLVQGHLTRKRVGVGDGACWSRGAGVDFAGTPMAAEAAVLRVL